MEHQKILDSLSEANNSKFVTRKRNTSNANYGVQNEIIYNAELLKSNDITVTTAPET